jgi:formamidopyrimidine-DNA glycosylase
MPELPEVQTVVDTLRPAIAGRRVVRVDLRRTDILLPVGFDLTDRLVGRTIASVDRRGKRIVIRLADGNRFYIHLGMTGRLTMELADAPLLPHTHLIVGFAENELRFRDPRRFGGIWWLGLDESSDDQMGPEPLALRADQLAKRLSRTTRAIKNALLDQSVIAGLGNALTKPQIAKLNRAIKFTLRKALHHRGSTLRDYFDANGNPGGFQKLHTVYDRAGLACRTCKTPIERIVLGGRSTHFCPNCQPKHINLT